MAFGNSTFSDAGSAVSDLYQASADRMRARGSRLQAQDYTSAAALADENAQFAETSTRIKEAQAARSTYQAIGQEQSDIAGAGFANSGSALDLLASAAQQGALTKAVIGEQGYITEEGYRVQAGAYRDMASAANLEASAQEHAATGATWAGGISAAASVATLFT